MKYVGILALFVHSILRIGKVLQNLFSNICILSCKWTEEKLLQSRMSRIFLERETKNNMNEHCSMWTKKPTKYPNVPWKFIQGRVKRSWTRHVLVPKANYMFNVQQENFTYATPKCFRLIWIQMYGQPNADKALGTSSARNLSNLNIICIDKILFFVSNS